MPSRRLRPHAGVSESAASLFSRIPSCQQLFGSVSNSLEMSPWWIWCFGVVVGSGLSLDQPNASSVETTERPATTPPYFSCTNRSTHSPRASEYPQFEPRPRCHASAPPLLVPDGGVFTAASPDGNSLALADPHPSSSAARPSPAPILPPDPVAFRSSLFPPISFPPGGPIKGHFCPGQSASNNRACDESTLS